MDFAARLIALFFICGTAFAAPYTNTVNWGIGNPPYGGYSTISEHIAANGGNTYIKGKCSTPNPGTVLASASWTQTSSQNVVITCNYSDIAAPNNCPSAGTLIGTSDSYKVTTGTRPPSSVCLDGCQALTGSFGACYNGKCSSAGPFKVTGETCSTGGLNPVVPVAQDADTQDAACLKKKQCPGTLNGQKICVQCSVSSQSSAASSSESASNAASGASAVQSGGTKTESKNTTCEGGKCTTTTTTTENGSDGSSKASTKTETKDQADYCAANPKSKVCVEDSASSWAGTCQAFTCEGDAVQCAQAQASWKTACAMEGEPDARHQAGENAMAGGDKPAGHPGADPQSIPVALASAIDSSPLFSSSGACPDDVTLTVQGQTVTLPFSDMCPYLNMLGAAFMAACYLMGAFIVFRS